MLLIASSLGGGLDPNYQKANGKKKHGANHVDCLVGAQQGPFFEQTANAYINSIRPVDVVAISGLNTKKLWCGSWSRNAPYTIVNDPKLKPVRVSHGKFRGRTVPEVIQEYEGPYAAIIYGSNNRDFLMARLIPLMMLSSGF